MARSKISLARTLFKEGKGESSAQKRHPTLATQFKVSVASMLVNINDGCLLTAPCRSDEQSQVQGAALHSLHQAERQQEEEGVQRAAGDAPDSVPGADGEYSGAPRRLLVPHGVYTLPATIQDALQKHLAQLQRWRTKWRPLGMYWHCFY